MSGTIGKNQRFNKLAIYFDCCNKFTHNVFIATLTKRSPLRYWSEHILMDRIVHKINATVMRRSIKGLTDMWRIPLIFTFSLIFFCAAAFAGNEKIKYKGLELDASSSAFKKSNPEFLCGKINQRIEMCLSDKSTYFGSFATKIEATIIDAKLKSIQIDLKFSEASNLSSEQFAKVKFIELRNELIKRHGNPLAPDEHDKMFKSEGKLYRWKNAKSNIGIALVPNANDKDVRHGVFVQIYQDGASELRSEIMEKMRKKDL